MQKKPEAAYAEQLRDRLVKQLRRRARELGYEQHKLEAAKEEAGVESPGVA